MTLHNEHPSIPTQPAPLTTLAWLVVALAVTAVLYYAAPYLLPVRVTEGPLLQLPDTDRAMLVWYTSRPVECVLTVRIDGTERRVPVLHTGRRHVARVDGLAPQTLHEYRIESGGRVLLANRAFQTNRPTGTRFAFVVAGDTGRGGRTQFDVAQQMQAVHPPADFVLHTGDVVYPDGARHRYEARFFAPYQQIIARIPFWPSLGNHDVEGRGPGPPYAAHGYLEVFELPENGPPGLPAEMSYWFDYADCRVVVIDSNLNADLLRAHVAPWAREVLAASGPRWRFAVLHHPPYTGGKYGDDRRLQDILVPVFDDTGVDVVFTGHDHNYQRIGPLRSGQPAEDGTLYIISGAGGARLYNIKEHGTTALRASDDSIHSFTHVIVETDSLELHQIDRFGRTLDSFRFPKRPEPAFGATAHTRP